ncbi:fatty acid desaturase [soil metagenome]
MRSIKSSKPIAVEWPTLVLAGVIYAGWLAATFWHTHIPAPLLPVVGGWLIAWHGSLQHETIHGHPTRDPIINRAIGWPPLSLWLPYELYRQSHVAHHATEHLTDPRHDPESRYLIRATAPQAILAVVQSTLLGRLILGAPIEIGRFLVGEGLAVVRGDAGRRRVWAAHLFGVTAIGLWLIVICRMSVSTYLLAFIYPCAALSLLRSFVEHRADAVADRRIAVVEAAPVLGLLFLNNNLHAAHHANPAAPWWRLPRLHLEQRVDLIALGAPFYRGYAEVARRYLLRPHDAAVYPYAGEAKAEECG